MQNDLTDNQKNRLQAYRLDPEFQAILEILAQGVRRPRYKPKANPLTEIPDMINESGYRDGALAVLSDLSGKDYRR